MGFPRYRYTGRDTYADRVKEAQHDEWAAAWTMTIAEAVGGLPYYERHDVYRIIHEIRRRVEAGDYGPPIAYPQPGPKAQAELKLDECAGVKDKEMT